MDHPFQPGTSWRLFFSEGNVNNRLIHIRAVVDNDYIVHCHWSNHRKGWYYVIDHVSLLELYQAHGHLTQTRSRYAVSTQNV